MLTRVNLGSLDEYLFSQLVGLPFLTPAGQDPARERPLSVDSVEKLLWAARVAFLRKYCVREFPQSQIIEINNKAAHSRFSVVEFFNRISR